MLQALVEFDSVESAKKTKHAINGADIYSGCCTIKVEFAKVRAASTLSKKTQRVTWFTLGNNVSNAVT